MRRWGLTQILGRNNTSLNKTVSLVTNSCLKPVGDKSRRLLLHKHRILAQSFVEVHCGRDGPRICTRVRNHLDKGNKVWWIEWVTD